MRSKLLLLAAIIAGTLAASGAERSDRLRPRWMHSLPTPGNSTFTYVRESAVATSLPDARTECFSSLLQDAGFEKGVTVKSDYESHDSEHSVTVNGKSTDVTESHFTVSSTVSGKEVELQGVRIDEYWERKDDGKYYLTTLYARSQAGVAPRFDNVTLTSKYGLRGFWRSAIIPGWGQFYKGSNLKGGLILGGAAVLAGAIIYTDCMRADYADKILKTHLAQNKRTYATRRDNFATGRNICIGALGALYVYNLIDAIVAPGARRVVNAKTGNRDLSCRFGPDILPDMSPGMTAVITF